MKENRVFLSRLGPRGVIGAILYFPFVCILYIQGPFLRPKNSAVRIASGSEFYSSQWEIYFSQCLNKFLKFVEMEYLYKFITSKLKIHTDHADLVFNWCLMFTDVSEGRFFYWVVGIWQGIILTIWTFFKAKAFSFVRFLSSNKKLLSKIFYSLPMGLGESNFPYSFMLNPTVLCIKWNWSEGT